MKVKDAREFEVQVVMDEKGSRIFDEKVSIKPAEVRSIDVTDAMGLVLSSLEKGEELTREEIEKVVSVKDLGDMEIPQIIFVQGDNRVEIDLLQMESVLDFLELCVENIDGIKDTLKKLGKN